jgi:hypothetical protein
MSKGTYMNPLEEEEARVGGKCCGFLVNLTFNNTNRRLEKLMDKKKKNKKR